MTKTRATSVNIKQARQLVIDAMKANLTPMLSSSPGLGKSDLTKSIGEQFKLKVIDVRLSQSDSVDLNGYPMLDIENGVSTYLPFDTFPTEDTPIPEGYEGWLLLLDEITSAPTLVQAAAYRLVLDREVGQKKLHPKVAVIAAGNMATDKAIVNRMSTAMQSRMIHLTIHADLDTWVEWAIENDIDYRIIAFLQFKPDLLHAFDPNHNDMTFACPRTWEFLSRLVKKWPSIPKEKLPLITGTVSEGAGVEFKSFADIFESLPTKESILNDPDNVRISDDPSVKYAFTALLANIVEDDNVEAVMRFVDRLDMEFQVITMQKIMKKHMHLLNHKVVNEWKIKNIDQLT